ncbi:MAG: tRNA epoxyqueuosine(34) reductase QueG [Polyangiaceae bacterium]
MSLTAEALRHQATELGFDVVAFAHADEPLTLDHARYEDFIAVGRHGEMSYLADHVEARRRLDHDAILPGARTVICLARRYDRDDSTDPPLAKRIARYARGQDYHGFLRKRLGRLAATLRQAGHDARALCDTAPVLERAWAARAGLGFVGKNGLLIIPGQGSFCLLGEVVTTLALAPGAYGTPAGERCGSCRACLDACPTDAFVAPFVLEPRRCVAYWTIESRTAPPPELHAAIGEHLFGCDLCQDACPYNRLPPPPPTRTAPFAPHPRWATLTPDALVDPAVFTRATQGSPLRRATPAGLARNALLLLRHDPATVAAAREHPDPMVATLADHLSEEP